MGAQVSWVDFGASIERERRRIGRRAEGEGLQISRQNWSSARRPCTHPPTRQSSTGTCTGCTAEAPGMALGDAEDSLLCQASPTRTLVAPVSTGSRVGLDHKTAKSSNTLAWSACLEAPSRRQRRTRARSTRVCVVGLYHTSRDYHIVSPSSCYMMRHSLSFLGAMGMPISANVVATFRGDDGMGGARSASSATDVGAVEGLPLPPAAPPAPPPGGVHPGSVSEKVDRVVAVAVEVVDAPRACP